VGPRRTIESARHFRKMLGGTQRQAGIMAAAGLEAVEHMVVRLAQDHARARRLSSGLNAVHPHLSASEPQTNIVQVDVSKTARNSGQWMADLERVGLFVRPWGKNRLRCVTHRHIDDADIEFAVEAFRSVSTGLPD
jgi:threonine aldolase